MFGGAAVRAGQRIEDSGGDKSFGERAAHVYGAGSGYAGRSGGASAFVSGCEVAAGNFGKSEDAAEARGDWVVFSEVRAQRRVPGSSPHGELFARLFPDTEMLASGWRKFHPVADGDHEKSRDGQAQRGLLSHASVRRAHDWDALADAEAWRGTFPQRAGKKSERED